MTQENRPTDRELQVLKVLWDRPKSTVRDVYERFREQGETLAYTTVLSLLQVMEQKGFVGHDAEGKAYFYFAKVERSKTFRDLAGAFLDRVFDGGIEEFVAHALSSREISSQELDRLEAFLAAARKAKLGRSKRGGA